MSFLENRPPVNEMLPLMSHCEHLLPIVLKTQHAVLNSIKIHLKLDVSRFVCIPSVPMPHLAEDSNGGPTSAAWTALKLD